MERRRHFKMDNSWADGHVNTACGRAVLLERATGSREDVTCKLCQEWLSGYGPVKV